jgi:nitroreductase/NAD-dependent dihydropyrimidine dehydrogenase PreA subunit
MFKLDENKCTACGLCCEDCVVKCLEIMNGKAHLVGKCIECGHCVAICPQGAVSLGGYDMSEVKEYSRDNRDKFQLDHEQLLNAIMFRRSIRKFEQRPVENEKIQKIIEAGRYTPTAKNRQNVEYIVVQNNDNIEMLEEKSTKILRRVVPIDENDKNFMFKAAPTLILVVSEHEVNAALASANMALMAEAQGLGVLYVGYFTPIASRNKEIRNILGLEKKQKVVTCLAIGYPAVKYKRTVPRKAAVIKWM